ncbi:hypothetical protein J6590_046672 [Homalodisca vitripennis]|nr:hypothetical protein J6590_046672 [Homalodisca vitripennis]
MFCGLSSAEMRPRAARKLAPQPTRTITKSAHTAFIAISGPPRPNWRFTSCSTLLGDHPTVTMAKLDWQAVRSGSLDLNQENCGMNSEHSLSD